MRALLNIYYGLHVVEKVKTFPVTLHRPALQEDVIQLEIEGIPRRNNQVKHSVNSIKYHGHVRSHIVDGFSMVSNGGTLLKTP